jgi:hypothetical protein
VIGELVDIEVTRTIVVIGRQDRAKAKGVVFGRQLKLTRHQRLGGCGAARGG